MEGKFAFHVFFLTCPQPAAINSRGLGIGSRLFPEVQLEDADHFVLNLAAVLSIVPSWDYELRVYFR